MFSTLGLFKNVQCPRENECSLPNCFFDHTIQDKVSREKTSSPVKEYDPMSAGDAEQPPLKKRRLQPEDSNLQQPPRQHAAVKPVEKPRASTTSTLPITNKQPLQKLPQPVTSAAISSRGTASALGTTAQTKPVSMIRPVSPPGKVIPKPVASRPPEKLAPRSVAKSPVPFKSRLSYIELLHKFAKAHNSEVEKDSPTDTHLVLESFELIKLVLDDEEQAAAASSVDIYKNTMSQRYLRYKNISISDWKTLVKEKFRTADKDVATGNDIIVSSGLAVAEEIELLRGLKTAVSGLESFGYVTAPPTADQIQKAEEAASHAYGFEICDRCGTRFQVFPGRNTEGRLTTQGECNYHWARIPKPQTAKNARMFGAADTFYPCCNQPPGSEGCTKADCHVFKVSDPKRLASLWQFERTPETKEQRRTPVAFDCEMAYTTRGMELVRLTAISWPEKKELLDVLARPYGEILDLNTRFSGVSQEQFANAPAYDKSEKTGQSQSLRKVESPAVARQLLFNLIAPDTPLIGHAIENDLNACRMVHPFIIDTVLLYPHPAGLPFRYGLKMLASKYLERGIQTAGAQGHDSKEDSVATGDLVRLKVAEKWKTMKSQGWTFQSARLVAPKNS